VTIGGQATDAVSLGGGQMLTVGLQSRDDIIPSTGLYHTEHEIRLGTVLQDRIRERGIGTFAELSSRWMPWFRTVLGLRGDAYQFDVNGAHRGSSIASPKASLVFAPTHDVELYLNGGFGFHSDDARTPALVRSRGAELGARVSPVRAWRSTVALWALTLGSELIWDGDHGTNAPSFPSDRLGVTWSNTYRVSPHLTFDLDASSVHARFAGQSQPFIPGALENTLVGGFTWTPASHGIFAALHVRRLGSYPLVQSDSVRAPSTTVVNADGGYQLAAGVRVQLTLLNMFNSPGDDIDYYYASRLPGEPAAGVMDQHLHPIEPRQLRVSVSWGL
jgi:outer membrane receptor protein involved in Fe transport